MNEVIQKTEIKEIKNIKDYVEPLVWLDTHTLDFSVFDKYKKLPVVQNILSKYRANINANGWNVHSSVFNSSSKNDKLSRIIYDIIEGFNIDSMINDIIFNYCLYGNSFCVFDKEFKPIIHNPKLFSIDFDKYQLKANAIHFKYDTNGVKTIKLTPNVDCYHFKAFTDSNQPFALSPIENCIKFLDFIYTTISVNTNKIAYGNIGVTFLKFRENADNVFVPGMDMQGKQSPSVAQLAINKFKEIIQGFKNSFKNVVASVQGLEDVIEVGSTNRDMELIQMLEKAEYEVYQNFGIEKTTENSNYSNARAFNYQLYDLIGRPLETQIEHFVNYFLWFLVEKETGYKSSKDLYFKFNEPNDPDEETKKQNIFTLFIDSYKANRPILTLEETREQLGLPAPTKELLDEWEKLNPTKQQILPQTPIPTKAPQIENIENQTIVKDVEKKTLKTELFSYNQKLLFDSDLYKKKVYNFEKGEFEDKNFLQAWIKAITKQLLKSVENYNENEDFILKKIETFYSINALKKDILSWVEEGVAIAKDENKTNKEYSYSQEILDYIDKRAVFLLKGDVEFDYKGVDEATLNRVLSIIKQNNGKSHKEIVNIITDNIKDISKERADVIVETEVVSAVEKGRFDYYKQQELKEKKHLIIGDGRDTKWSKQANAEGWVDIDFEYTTQWGKSQTMPFHYRDRGTMIYR